MGEHPSAQNGGYVPVWHWANRYEVCASNIISSCHIETVVQLSKGNISSQNVRVPLDFLPLVEYNKRLLETANHLRPTCSFAQSMRQKEVQIERIFISSADSRQMGRLCALGESVHTGRKDTGLRTFRTCLGSS